MLPPAASRPSHVPLRRPIAPELILAHDVRRERPTRPLDLVRREPTRVDRHAHGLPRHAEAGGYGGEREELHAFGAPFDASTPDWSPALLSTIEGAEPCWIIASQDS